MIQKMKRLWHSGSMVSVIIPTYNRKALLLQAAASVLMQTVHDMELIIVDDGSDDGSREAGDSLLQDPRVRWLSIPHSGFPGAVRNIGVQAAQGEWIAFLDSDDLWLPRRLQLQLELAERQPGIRCIHGREIWLRGEQIVSQRTQRHGRSGDIFADAVKKCIIGPSTVLMRRGLFDSLGGFREDLEIAEDYELWLRLTAGEPVGYTETPAVLKRAGHGSLQLSEKYGQIEKFRIAALEKLTASRWFARYPGKQRLAEGELVRKCLIVAAGARKRGHEEEARYYDSLAHRFSSSLSSS